MTRAKRSRTSVVYQIKVNPKGVQAADLAPDAGHQYDHLSAAPPDFATFHRIEW